MPSAAPIPLIRVEDAPEERLSAAPIPLVRVADAPEERLSAAPIPLVGAAQRAAAGPPLLRVRDLSVSFALEEARLRALDRVSFDVPRGGTVALVGESGSGKTVTAQSVLRLLPSPPATIDGGSIELEGRDLLALSEREMCAVRGGKIAMVFQEPMTSLNPVYTVGAQVAEAIRLHRPVSRGEARRQALEVLRKVGLPEPERRMDSYPHELSGGMRQRVMIAIALAPGPALVVADEPTTALDMATQAQILDLLTSLRAELSMSLLLIAHDLAVVSELADEIVVLYAGVVVERGPAELVLGAPAHPYTRALLRSTPRPRAFRRRDQRARRLPTIPGAPPDLRPPPPGCRFHERCDHAEARCRDEMPELLRVHPGAPQLARCFLAGSLPDEEAAPASAVPPTLRDPGPQEAP
ncbi:MAG: ABC transporter ATP-binding protein [Polyangiaceae bacterium]|nr:ABC transporter ATP-binding protein [Polyangiaceae bacterium]